MKLPRRRFLRLAACAAALPAAPQPARAQAYPARSVRIVVPVAAGGANDVTGRLIGQWLSEHLGQQFFIENRPGAGTNVGAEAVIRASPDGYTLLIAGSNAAINATLFGSLNFNFIRDTAPIASIVRVPQIMQVNPALPVQSVPEFIAYANRHGLGRQRFTGAYHRRILQTDDRHGSDAYPLSRCCTGGDRSAWWANPGGVHRDGNLARTHQAGKLRALAVTTATRSEALPDTPTLGELIPGFEASQWIGLVAPKDTPTTIISILRSMLPLAIPW
jgi:tripartite-type tricarboxylate transporter receptor subunit TctC